MTDQETLSQAEVICQSLREEDDGVRREVLAHAGSRWALGILHALGVYGAMRHAEIKRQMTGVTQRMLTKTLRAMERDGLLVRREFGEIPPRVEYELTPLGRELLIRMSPIWTWVVENVEDFRKARRIFDSQEGKKPAWQVPTPVSDAPR
ncbi:helix-turn-helix transcriptional regulator [Pseudomonas carnis]|jgi:DNA-binding HxlR family transcriptional regulator|uniref:Helix-turn-helix transcriptional regulator n=1 Tax=Pseudomonas carnis TaxID=2487355 RepID=A0ABT5RFA6_9PSED|nr:MULTISPECIES: helix-turn-helix domain-containing protein [Pseudomonas]MBA1255477.1 helix-turn-helix transcriptional regulator [Pseudomonas carnis]MBA1270555.1 helix-turn-helix transcriptional regulator [Pseudomonas carnis]MBA1298629.1 helix-turn-helix transcriptional regulator [Pseudomonas carnis]MBJ2201188.1 helix-turn-helix transcriptional regulator [Pseudomonas carnis]MBJ2282066.1 helix-turn-helix transcriptional regulator [Pseudomonas sp. MF6767]